MPLADTAWTYAAARGVDAAADVVRRRRGGALDPALVDRFCAAPTQLLGPLLRAESLWDAALAAEPLPRGPLDDGALDGALRAFAEFADLKSSSTIGHSLRVAELAGGAAMLLGLPAKDLRRAGWVHDVGRVGVSSTVWEKKAPLTHAEREQVRLHPYLTERLLARPAGLAGLGRIAASHHERLDGSGYHRRLAAGALSSSERLLGVADTYAAMCAPRAHRAPLPADRAAERLRAEVR